MQYFNLYALKVPLQHEPHLILMSIRDDVDSVSSSVVYADPTKLRCFVPERDDLHYMQWKHPFAVDGIMEAAKNASTCGDVIGPDENPLPMSYIGCVFDGEVKFIDGMTRADMLIRLGAEYIPLQVPTKEALAVHALVGKDDPKYRPEPASKYVVPSEMAHRLMIEHWQPK